MARLAQTAGLTDVQSEILATVRSFVDKEVIPHHAEWEAAGRPGTDSADEVWTSSP